MAESETGFASAGQYQEPSLVDLRVPVPRGLIPEAAQQAKESRRLVRGVLLGLGGLVLSVTSGALAYALVGTAHETRGWLTAVALIAVVRAMSHWWTHRGEMSRSLGLLDEAMVSLFVATAGSLVGLVTVLAIEGTTQIHNSRGLLLVEWGLGLALWAAYLTGLKTVATLSRRNGRNIRQVLIVGNSRTSRRLIEHISRHPEAGYRIAAVVPFQFSTGPSAQQLSGEAGAPRGTEDSSSNDGSWGNSVSGERDLPSLVADLSIDDVVFATSVPRHQVIRLLSWCHPMLTVCQVSPSADRPSLRTDADMAGFPVLNLLLPSLSRSGAFLKSVTDMSIASIALIITSPVVLISALLIKTTSRGPAMLRQTRVGQHGQLFTLYKLRTMRVGCDPSTHQEYVEQLMSGVADQSSQGVYKLEQPETTAVGRWLRRLSIDELPQLWNVLNGSMSIVGPRPPMPYEIPMHDPRQIRRLDVKPGLTGLWQVSARNNVGYREMVELDLQYIERWSLTRDLRIILRTPAAMLRHRTTS